MSLNLGNAHIKDIYLGATKIKEAYLGSVKVYGKSPIYKERYEYTLFESQYGGVSSGTVSDAFRNYDIIGIRLSNDTNTTEPRKTRGSCWKWIDWSSIKTSSSNNILIHMTYDYYDGSNFCNFLFRFNYDNDKSFNTSVVVANNGWKLYTKADDNSRMYCSYNEQDLSIISKIVGVKYQ